MTNLELAVQAIQAGKPIMKTLGEYAVPYWVYRRATRTKTGRIRKTIKVGGVLA